VVVGTKKKKAFWGGKKGQAGIQDLKPHENEWPRLLTKGAIGPAEGK